MVNILLIIFSQFLFSGSIEVFVSKRVVTLDDEVVVKFRVSGKMDGELEMPKVAGLEIQNRGTSSQTSIINGSYSSHVEYTFAIIPLKTGELRIPSFGVKVDGKIEKIAAISILVKEGVLNPDFLLSRKLSKNEIYLGESLESKVIFKHPPVRIEAVWGKVDFPNIEILKKEKQKIYETNGAVGSRVERVFSETWRPTEAGTFEIMPHVLQVMTQQSRRMRLRTKVDTLVVKPLPLPQPKNFSGLVGEFLITAQISNDRIKTGDSLLLKIKISGDGNLDQMKPYQMSFPRSFKSYADDPLDESEKTELYSYTLVPTKSGEYSLDGIGLNYFSPKHKKYENVTLPPIKILVTGKDLAIASEIPYGNARKKTIKPELSTSNRVKIESTSFLTGGVQRSDIFIFLVLLSICLFLKFLTFYKRPLYVIGYLVGRKDDESLKNLLTHIYGINFTAMTPQEMAKQCGITSELVEYFREAEKASLGGIPFTKSSFNLAVPYFFKRGMK